MDVDFYRFSCLPAIVYLISNNPNVSFERSGIKPVGCVGVERFSSLRNSNARFNMQLIGMLDSPFVRRTAISLKLLGVPFEHRSVSVFSTFDQFRALNPVVKAPTLILDDGQVLMDSTLILDYAERLAGPSAAIFPADLAKRARAVRLTGLAMAANEKSVQIVYERKVRPADKLYQAWVDRVRVQLLAAYDALEKDLRAQPLHGAGQALGHEGVAVAVAWGFTQMMVPDVVPAAGYPSVQAFSAHCEQLPVFKETPAT